MKVESRVFLLLVALLVIGHLILFVSAGLSLALGLVSLYILFLLYTITKLFP